jgi:hypothetical protein
MERVQDTLVPGRRKARPQAQTLSSQVSGLHSIDKMREIRGLEPTAEVEGALLVVEVLHLPHPKLLGLLGGSEHLHKRRCRRQFSVHSWTSHPRRTMIYPAPANSMPSTVCTTGSTAQVRHWWDRKVMLTLSPKVSCAGSQRVSQARNPGFLRPALCCAGTLPLRTHAVPP